MNRKIESSAAGLIMLKKRDTLPPVFLGLSPLLRVILTARGRGIRRFCIVGSSADTRRVEATMADPRIRKLKISAEFIQTEAEAAERIGQFEKQQRCWFFYENSVFLPEALNELAAAWQPGHCILHMPAGSAFGSSGAGCGGLGLFVPGRTDPEMVLKMLTAGFEYHDNRTDPAVCRLQTDRKELCFCLDSSANIRRATKAFLHSVRKSSDGFISRNLNRHISLFLTGHLIKLRVSPFTLSVVNLVFGMASGWFAGRGGYWNMLAGGFLFQWASIFDGCDGENARLTFRESDFGVFFDNTCDILTLIVFLINLPVGLYAARGSAVYFFLGGGVLASVAVFYLIMILYVRKAELKGSLIQIVMDIEANGIYGADAAAWIDRAAARIAGLYRHDVYAFIFFVFALSGLPEGIIWGLTILSPVEAVYMFLYAKKRLQTKGGSKRFGIFSTMK